MQLLPQYRVGLVLGCAVLVAGCAPTPVAPPASAPTSVTVSYPVEREVTDYAHYTARTAAVESVEVRARVDGYLDLINFKEGALVKKGDVLFVIDPRPFVAELNRSKAQLEQAQAEYQHALTQIESAEAAKVRADAGLENARLRIERATKLLLKGGISQEESDERKSELRKAEADVRSAIAGIASARAEVISAKAAEASARAAVAIAELNVQYTRVTAPIDGRIGREFVTVGNLIQAGQNGGGTLLTTLVSVNPIYAYFDVDERTVLRVRQLIREGKATSARETAWPVSLGLASDEGFPKPGTINFVDNQINPKTGTLRLRGVFPNSEQTLDPGFFGRVRVPVGQPHDAVLVTDRAIDNDQGQKIVYVVNEKNEVVARPVRTGALHDGLREITDGLKLGERVVVNGLQQVRPGMTAEPKIVQMPGQRPSATSEPSGPSDPQALVQYARQR